MRATFFLPIIGAVFVSTVIGGDKRLRDTVPSDFRVTIHDYPGLSDWKPFETTITADGSVQQTVYIEGRDRKKRSRISLGSVARLFTAIQKADFFSLAEEYPTDAEDCATYVITVRANGRSHKVTFATCFRKPGTEADSKRFLKIWAAALRAFPSPNPEQKPGVYSR